MPDRIAMTAEEAAARLAACTQTQTNWKDWGRCLDPDSATADYGQIPAEGYEIGAAVVNDAALAKVREAIKAAGNAPLTGAYASWFGQTVEGTPVPPPEGETDAPLAIIPGFRLGSAEGGADVEGGPDKVMVNDVVAWNTVEGDVDQAGARNTTLGASGLIFGLRWINKPVHTQAVSDERARTAEAEARATTATGERDQTRTDNTTIAAQRDRFRLVAIGGAILAGLLVVGLGIRALVKRVRRPAQAQQPAALTPQPVPPPPPEAPPPPAVGGPPPTPPARSRARAEAAPPPPPVVELPFTVKYGPKSAPREKPFANHADAVAWFTAEVRKTPNRRSAAKVLREIRSQMVAAGVDEKSLPTVK